MEPEIVEAELVLPSHFSFKRVHMYEKYPKGQARGRHWKHLKQIVQAENYQNYPPDEPNCEISVPCLFILFFSFFYSMPKPPYLI
ncbi:hypothetical protein TanjilG_28879 [Lupinus angustifolius]|uniref:Uncharacterized protein n=1 Tax=Lupinus angustifolius TaxID=3871 RepID=A0A1J7GMT1_LUPAN|nr:hypothetical protein TanjilG_28879 [Lupinus angustifolius]